VQLGLELSNATSSICWTFVPLLDEAHNPKVVSSNLTLSMRLDQIGSVLGNSTHTFAQNLWNIFGTGRMVGNEEVIAALRGLCNELAR